MSDNRYSRSIADPRHNPHTRTDAFEVAARRWPELEARLVELKAQDPSVRKAWPDAFWPVIPDEAFLAARAAQDMFSHTNGFLPPPSLRQIEAELCAMVGDVLEVPADGRVTITGGGTEGNFLAMRAARNRYWARGGEDKPRVVLPLSAHPSFSKAASDLQMNVTRVPLSSDYRADPAAIEKELDESVCLMVGSAPNYPFGVVDPIPALGEIAERHDILLHVDACVGGFLLPFLRRLGLLSHEFDFQVPGVSSIAADLHKFGYCLNGISTFSIRDESLFEYQRFELPHDSWGFQRYVRPGFIGSRSGSVIAAAWATMRSLGEAGYVENARLLVAGAAKLHQGIESIPGLRLMAPHEGGIVVIEADDPAVDCEKLAGEMQAAGWPVRSTDEPSRLWMILSPLPMDFYEGLLNDLGEAVDLVRSGQGQAGASRETYGS